MATGNGHVLPPAHATLGSMADEKRAFRTPGSTGQIVAATIVALCGIVLCVRAAGDGDVVPAVVAAIQAVAGTYLVVWHTRVRRRTPP